MARHATRFAGRRRRNNGRAAPGAALSLTLSLCPAATGRAKGRAACDPDPDVSKPIRMHAARCPPHPSDRRKPSVPSVSSPRSPRVQPTDPTSEGRRPCRDPFFRFPKDNTDRLSVSLSLSFHPWCCCCCRWWWWWWVLTPPSPTRRALPLTASPFPKRSAGSLQTTPPPPLTHRRARATEEEGLALEEHVPGPRNPSWELAGAMFGVTRGRKRHRGSRRGRERGGALLCRRPPPRPASLFRVFQVQILNSSSKIQQVFRSKWARTESEREREREGGSCARWTGREGKRHRLG